MTISLPTDPAPRTYPEAVTLIRRYTRDVADPQPTTLKEIEGWLLEDALNTEDLLDLVQEFGWRLVAAHWPLDRMLLTMATIHPQLSGYGWHWRRSDRICDEVKVGWAASDSSAYRDNPLYSVLEHGLFVRRRLERPEVILREPLLAELREEGFTDYLAMPLRAPGGLSNALTLSTRAKGGFSDDQLLALQPLLHLFALHISRHTASRIAANTLGAYLGEVAGRRVLEGSIKRGDGMPIRCLIWSSDLRGFTDLSDRLSGPDVVAVLNAYFERLVAAVVGHGGEVLKFIGDGLLAVFPFEAYATGQQAALAALQAAEAGLRALEDLNDDAVTGLADIEGWRPLRTGIALHAGEVFFGNIGAPGRLDFTVIGNAVNTTARVEGLSKHLGRPILLTAEVAELLGEMPLEALGAHSLRGVTRPVEIFAPPLERRTP